MSLSKVTSDNGSSLARFTADHAAVPLLGAPLPNSPDGFKDYVWAAVHILGVAIVAGSKSFACGPQLGKSDIDVKTRKRIRENPNGPRTEFEARTGRHLSARPKSWAGLG